MTEGGELKRLRDGIQAFIDGSAEVMPRAKVWRKDGLKSKHDQCPHGEWMYDGCDQCADVYFQGLLSQPPEMEMTEIERLRTIELQAGHVVIGYNIQGMNIDEAMKELADLLNLKPAKEGQ